MLPEEGWKRGLVYGAIDGLLLTVFPWVVTWRAYNVQEKPFAKKIARGFLGRLFIVVISTAYHTGYSDFRSKKMIQHGHWGLLIGVENGQDQPEMQTAATNGAVKVV